MLEEGAEAGLRPKVVFPSIEPTNGILYTAT
jgi:hypothetical protein